MSLQIQKDELPTSHALDEIWGAIREIRAHSIDAEKLKTETDERIKAMHIQADAAAREFFNKQYHKCYEEHQETMRRYRELGEKVSPPWLQIASLQFLTAMAALGIWSWLS